MVDVLVVDPGELGELLATLFEQYGMSALCAKTGEHALELALQERPGVVVVEYELPDVNGLEVADLIRAELDTKVVLTYALARANEPGNEDFQSRVSALDAAFSRPFRSLTLIQRVSDLLGGDAESRPAIEETQVGAPRPASDEVVLLLDQVAEDELGYSSEEDIVLDVDVTDLEAPEAEEAFTYRARPEAERVEVTEKTPMPRAPSASSSVEAPAREGVTRTLSEANAWEPTPSDVTDVHALWRRLREANAERGERAPVASEAGVLTKQPTTRSGRLTPKVLAELLEAFHQTQTTGEIWLNRERARRVLLVARGVIVGARSNLAHEELPALAKKRGVLDDAQITGARALLTKKTVRSFDEAVLKAGLLDERAYLKLLDEQVRRIVLGAFGWQDGTFRVTLEGRGKELSHPVHMSAGDAIVRGIVLAEGKEALREAAPDDARFAPNPGAPFGLEDVTLTGDEARLVIAMDGTKTVADLMTLFPELPERLVRGLAAGLFRLGVVRFAGRGPAEARRISFF